MDGAFIICLLTNVVGDSLHIIKTTDGIWKKLWIEKLDAGVYFFKHANLDGTNLITQMLILTTIQTKSLCIMTLIQIKLWTESQLMTNGILHLQNIHYCNESTLFCYRCTLQRGHRSCEGITIGGSPLSYTNFANHNFEFEINEIGYDWKTFDMGSFSYIIDNL